MPYTKTPWVANVTPVTAASMNNIEAGIAGLSAPAPSATPPASPADGDIWYLPADAANGIVWQFRYNAGSASAYKWEFVGGTPLWAQVMAQESTSSGIYVDLATAGPLITVPRTGDYMFDWGAEIQAAAGIGYAGVCFAAAASTSDNDTVHVFNANAAAAEANVSRRFRATVPPANLSLRLAYRTGGTLAYFGKRWLSLTPVRVS